MNKLADALEGGSQGWQGARYVRIEGATHVRDRHAAVTAFRRDPAIRVALLSVTAAGARSCAEPRLWHVGRAEGVASWAAARGSSLQRVARTS